VARELVLVPEKVRVGLTSMENGTFLISAPVKPVKPSFASVAAISLA